jgi:hypothetical protein
MTNLAKDYQRDYDKALKKYDGMVWYEPSEAERKAIVAEQRKGRELAYAPTGTSLDAGKLMKVSDLEKRLADQKAAEEAKQAALIQKEALEKATRDGKNVPVPQQSPIERPVQQAALQTAPATKSFWNLFSKGEPQAQATPPVNAAPAEQSAAEPTAQQPAAQPQPASDQKQAAAPTGANPQVATAPVAAGETAPAEQPPKKRPFWKIWGN